MPTNEFVRSVNGDTTQDENVQEALRSVNQDILVNYVAKLKEAGVDLSFIPDNGEEILNGTDGNRGAAAETSGPVATSVS